MKGVRLLGDVSADLAKPFQCGSYTRGFDDTQCRGFMAQIPMKAPRE